MVKLVSRRKKVSEMSTVLSYQVSSHIILLITFEFSINLNVLPGITSVPKMSGLHILQPFDLLKEDNFLLPTTRSRQLPKPIKIAPFQPFINDFPHLIIYKGHV